MQESRSVVQMRTKQAHGEDLVQKVISGSIIKLKGSMIFHANVHGCALLYTQVL